MATSLKIRNLFTLSLKEARKYVNMDTEYEFNFIQTYINEFVFKGL